MHEAQLHDENLFVTLTYNDENLTYTEDGLPTLNKTDYPLFMKRLRKNHSKARFFQCGEYGDQLARPHHHSILFGVDFPDKVLWKTTREGNLWTSETLNNLWKKGLCVFGDVTFESASYVSGYILKKRTGPGSSEHYQGKLPEYTTMSRRPGIGRPWLDRFETDAYPSDFVLSRGRKMRPPDYYDKVFAERDPSTFQAIKASRISRASDRAEDQTFDRLLVRERSRLLKLKQKSRSYEK